MSRIIKLGSLYNTIYNIEINKNNLIDYFYLDDINIENKQLFNFNYFKFFKNQFINNNNKNQIKRNNYKTNLTILNIKSIENLLIENYIKILKKQDINLVEKEIYKFNIISFKDNNFNKIYINLDTHIKIIKSLLIKYGKVNIKIFDHKPELLILIIPIKNDYKLNTLINNLSLLTNEKNTISINKLVSKCINNIFNEIIKNIIIMLSKYRNLTKYFKLDKDFYEFTEHIIFNASFDTLKQHGLKSYINKCYLNNFNEKKELMFKNNKYISLYYPNYESLKDKNKLQMSNVGLYSISKPDATQKIINIINNKLKFKKLNPKDLIITDGTAGLGGDTIAFAKNFKYVNSVEIQKIHHDIIKNNANLYDLNNIDHINNDYTKIYNKLKNDIIFLDSPWGGTSYMSDTKTELTMFGTNLKFNEFIKNCLEINNKIMIFIKCPVNYSVNDLDNDLLDSGVLKNIQNFEVNGINNFLLISLY